MDLKSGELFWPSQAPRFPALPSLQRDVHCDVAVVGAGLTGALVARALSHEGIDTVLLDKRHVAEGSTSASTALIQYEIDVPLFRLIKMRGIAAAVRCYQLCRQAIDHLEEVVLALDAPCGFIRRSSLYLARTTSDAND